MHWAPAAHAWHMWPSVPQAMLCVPMAQMAPSQHPGQLPGVHPEPGKVHKPPCGDAAMQAYGLGQGWQVSPPLPHCVAVSPI
jgi:hypothetical protein